MGRRDAGYTHTVLSKSFSLKAQNQPGTYCLSLNVAYDYSPPRPDQEVVSKICYSVTSTESIRVIAPTTDLTSLLSSIAVVLSIIASVLEIVRRLKSRSSGRAVVDEHSETTLMRK